MKTILRNAVWLIALTSSAGASGPLESFRETTLQGSDSAPGDRFGHALAVSGNTAVVGAPDHDLLSGADAGAVYVFEHDAPDWVQVAKLTGPFAAAGDGFGAAIGFDGTTIVVGAARRDNLGVDAGAAYVFERSGTGWVFAQPLFASDGAVDDLFGSSVAVDGTTLVVGAPGADATALDDGAAYVFERTGSGWTEIVKLVPSTPDPGDAFGTGVDIDGDSLLVGAPFYRFSPDQGAGYVFRFVAGAWIEEAVLTDNSGKFLGTDVSIDGDRAFVAGRQAYPFARVGTSWSLEAGGASTYSNLHTLSVELMGDRALAAGPVVTYVLERVEGVWEQKVLVWSRLLAGGGDLSVAHGPGDRLIVGAPLVEEGGSTGIALSFALRPVPEFWAQTDVLTANDAATGDHLGASVQLDGDTVMAGAPLDNNLAGTDAGSVHVFVDAAAVGRTRPSCVRSTRRSATGSGARWRSRAIVC